MTDRGLPAAVCWTAVLLSLLNSGNAQEAIPRPTAGEVKVRKALDEKTEFDFVERSLAEVAQAIGERHHIEVQLDRAQLEDAGIAAEEPIITRQIKGVSLRTALRLVLRDLGMTYLMRDGYLLLTKSSRCEDTPSTKFYPVGDLIGTNNGLRPPAPPSARNQIAQEDAKRLIDLITFAVAPTTWDEVGGQGAIKDIRISSALAVSQIEEVHEELAALLAALRLVRDKQIKAAKVVVAPLPAEDAEPEVRLSVFRLLKEPMPVKVAVPRFAGNMGIAAPPAEEAQGGAPNDAANPPSAGRLELLRQPVSAESIAAALPDLIEPDSWQPKGPGVARAIGDTIVVRHTDDMRQRVAMLLEELAPRQVVHHPPPARPPPLAVRGWGTNWPQTAEPPLRTRGMDIIGTEEIDEAIERALTAQAELDVSEAPLGDVLITRVIMW